jgi:1,4-alpha-glucan branching enzyme
VVRTAYRIGVPEAGHYREILNTDAETYGGSAGGNPGGLHSEPAPWQGRDHSMQIELPPLALLAFVAD